MCFSLLCSGRCCGWSSLEQTVVRPKGVFCGSWGVGDAGSCQVGRLEIPACGVISWCPLGMVRRRTPGLCRLVCSDGLYLGVGGREVPMGTVVWGPPVSCNTGEGAPQSIQGWWGIRLLSPSSIAGWEAGAALELPGGCVKPKPCTSCSRAGTGRGCLACTHISGASGPLPSAAASGLEGCCRPCWQRDSVGLGSPCTAPALALAADPANVLELMGRAWDDVCGGGTWARSLLWGPARKS